MALSRSILYGLALALGLAAAPAIAADGSPVVVELFTSQGCNSCPPADRLMGELARRDDVIGLSFHVDYWDYIGWHDTFALPESAERQRRYVDRIGGRYVYTPQMIIDGREQVVGSKRSAVDGAIEKTAATPGVALTVQPLGEGRWTVSAPPATLPAPAEVWAMHFDEHHDVAIERGENRGKTLSYFNVVRKVERLARWDGRAPLSLPLDLTRAFAEGRSGCVVILQAAGFGPVLGATRIVGTGG